MKHWFELSKYEFIKHLRQVGIDNTFKFSYYANGNDPCNPCGTIKKQATYEFSIIGGGQERMIVYKNHRRDHETVKEELMKKFTGYAKSVGVKISNI